MFRNQSAQSHQFSMIPRADIPRSRFQMQKTLKTTFDASGLVPIFCEEVLPGDTFNVKATLFGRLATPLFPIMDNLYMETFYFFVPNRLVWANWPKFMGEQTNPGDSISFTIPQITSAPNGWPIGSLGDHFGLATVGQVSAGRTSTTSVLPLRAYNLIYNSWFRDENLCNQASVSVGDGPDSTGNYIIRNRGKRHDYFTSCLPFVQKGTSVSLPLGTQAPIKGLGVAAGGGTLAAGISTRETNNVTRTPTWQYNTGGVFYMEATTGVQATAFPSVYADLSQATAATINQLRQAFQIQKLLERDARGGTRYTEIIRSHFGVVSPDARLNRPEYLGGGSTAISINPVAQTSATGVTGGSTPNGTLAGVGTVVGHNHGFTGSFTEHGYIIGLVNVRADLTYQQGVRRHWFRLTRYDFYFPAFAALGEQAVLNREIYTVGGNAGDAQEEGVFGYQERWAEYRYNPSEIHGLFRSTAASTIDAWHLSQKFTALPTLNNTFIEENVPLQRITAVGAAANGQQLLLDAFFNMQVARPLPMYSVPGLVDHF